MSFNIGIFDDSLNFDLPKVSETYYGRSSLPPSKKLDQFFATIKARFPSLDNEDEIYDMNWDINYTKSSGRIICSFGTKAESDIAFDYVLDQAKNLNLVIYDPQGHYAFIGAESNLLPKKSTFKYKFKKVINRFIK